jgi:hypothetical protein
MGKSYSGVACSPTGHGAAPQQAGKFMTSVTGLFLDIENRLLILSLAIRHVRIILVDLL